MNSKQVCFTTCLLVVAIGLASTVAVAGTPSTTNEAVTRIAERLVEKQIKAGSNAGAWPVQGSIGSGFFTGTMVAGLADAYWMTCESDYQASAELGGAWILANAPECNFYYDEAYALSRLSELACDPQENEWRTALTAFFECVSNQPPDPDMGNLAGTKWYIKKIENALDLSYATLEVAYYTVAAYSVDALDKQIWRSELIRLLSAVKNTAAHPVLALGSATWALSLTGPMDNTQVDAGSTLWWGFPGSAAMLSELSPLLSSYIATGTLDGHFYFNYLPGDMEGGFTETNVYGIMGLAAAKEAGFDYRDEIDWVWSKVLNAIDEDGDVWFDAFGGPGGDRNATYYLYAGGLLQALSAAALPGDVDRNDEVKLIDLLLLAKHWLALDTCTACSRADLTRDRMVNLADFAKLAEGWLLER